MLHILVTVIIWTTPVWWIVAVWAMRRHALIDRADWRRHLVALLVGIVVWYSVIVFVVFNAGMTTAGAMVSVVAAIAFLTWLFILVSASTKVVPTRNSTAPAIDPQADPFTAAMDRKRKARERYARGDARRMALT